MEQGPGEEGMKQQHDQGPRRPKLAENQMSHHPQPPPPQKCPRCDSLNTKFCYYNNYSLSQPRYFCKTCRRYWTQGGTLRNVPVGGGCRKGKRPKTSSSSSSGENSRSLPNLQPPPLPLPQHQQQLQLPPHMTSMSAMVSSISGLPSSSQSLRNLPWGHAPASSLFPSSGLLSSLTAMQSLSRPQGISQPINLGGGTGAPSAANLPIFQGFNFPSSMKSQPLQMHQPTGFQGMVNQEKDGESFYPPDQNLGEPAARTSLNSWNHDDDNTANPSSSNSNFWNNSSGSTSSSMAGSLANPNQWPNFPGFGSSP